MDTDRNEQPDKYRGLVTTYSNPYIVIYRNFDEHRYINGVPFLNTHTDGARYTDIDTDGYNYTDSQPDVQSSDD